MSNNPAMAVTDMCDAIAEKLQANQSRIQRLLPDNITFVEFQSIFITAIRKSPEVWVCTWDSLFDCAIDSAIDGLPCDGRHAALVSRSVNVGTKNAKKFIQIACYTPMAYGIRKKLIESGAVLQIETTIVYANEVCKITRGTDPKIEHEQILSGDRGPWVGCYSVANLPNGRISIEFMPRDDIMEIKARAQTDYVWKQNETEMARKTVLRRHQKSLVGNVRMVDIEEKRMVAQIQHRYDRQMPAAAIAQRPSREPARITQDHQIQNNDLGTKQEHKEVERQGMSDARGEPASETKKAANAPAAEQGDDAGSFFEIPASPSEFDLWAADLKAQISEAASTEELLDLRRQNVPITEAAPEDVRQETEGLFTARIAELMTEES
jgi:recombination protein RecT